MGLSRKQVCQKWHRRFESSRLRQLGNEVKAESGVIKTPSVLMVEKIAKPLDVSIEELIK